MIITLERYKALAGIAPEETSCDEQIATLIAAVEDDYLAIRGKPFDRGADGGPVYPPGSELTAAEMLSWQLATLRGGVGTESERIGDYSVSRTQDLVRGYPAAIVRKIRRYARVLNGH